MHQVDFWIYPLLALAIVSLMTRLSLPIKWSWGFIIQAIPVLVLGVVGLYFEPKWVYASLGWLLVVLFYLPSKLFYSGMQRNLTELNSTAMRKIAGSVHYFFWGVAGEFWRDMALALAHYIDQEADKADEIISKWKVYEGLPKQVQGLPSNYRKIGNAVMWRWNTIIEEFESLPEENQKKLGNSVLLPTARAYAESNRFNEAARCIEMSKLGETIVPMNYLALSLLPFFSLTGSMDRVSSLLEILSKSKGEFTESSKYYWLGRCFKAQGDKDKAKESFQQSYQLAKSDIFRSRLDNQIQSLDSDEGLIEQESVKPYVERVWEVFKSSSYIQELLSPQRKSIAVFALVIIIALIHFVNELYNMPFIDLFGLSVGYLKIMRLSILEHFALIPFDFYNNGEYYRLISYLFLHKHWTHMIFNAIGLIWFGRICENIFGTTRFIGIYLVGGALSGVAHVLLSPNLPAVGASGAVMAVFGAVAMGIYRLKNKIPESIWRFKISMLGGLALFQIILDQLIPHVAVFAHLGGLFAGVAFGLVLSIRSPNTDQHEITGQYVSG